MSIGARYIPDHILELGNGTELWCDDLGVFGAASASVESVSLPRLRRALAAHSRIWGEQSAQLWLSADSPKRFDDESSPALPYALVLYEGELVLAHALEIHGDSIDESDVIAALKPVLSRWDAVVLSISPDEDRSTRMTMLVRFPTPRRTVRDAIRLGEELGRALSLIGGAVGVDWVRDVLDAGLWDLLIGLDETTWLEAKRQHYRHDARDELNFASDVAGLCNSEGGLLVIGAKTKSHPEGDRIVAINQAPLPLGIARRYRRLIQRLVYPIPKNIVVTALPGTELAGIGVLVVEVPNQPADLRPFILAGGPIGDSVHGGLIGIPIRREADTSWMSPAALHARLRIGRAALGD